MIISLRDKRMSVYSLKEKLGHASHVCYARLALPSSRSLQRRSPKLFPRFPIQRSLQRSFPQSYFIPRFTVHHARPALPSRSLYRSSPQAISKLFPRFPLRPRSCSRKFLFTFHWLFQFFLVEAAEEVGIWNYCWFIFISRLQFGSAAVKHDSSIAAFAMADGFDPSGLSWAWKGGSQFRISCHHPELGTWLCTPWGVDCTVLAKADWQAPEHFLPSFLACLLPSFLPACLRSCLSSCLPAFRSSFLPSLLLIVIVLSIMLLWKQLCRCCTAFACRGFTVCLET